MTEKDFIKASIDDLVRTFPNTRVRYENHELSNTHFVEVVPNELYRLNDDYHKWEEGIVFKFISLFPSQNICFISDDDIVGIENVDYEMKGELYDLEDRSEACGDGSEPLVQRTSVKQELLFNTIKF